MKIKTDSYDRKVKIINCYECKFFNSEHIQWCNNLDMPTNKYGYCAWGKEVENAKVQCDNPGT